MIPSPITRVLSSMTRNGVDCLLMGGQACVLYGGAEFSRDIDFVLHVDPTNLERLSRTLAELNAEVIAVPPFGKEYLERGHAIHFRCGSPGVERLRINVMSRLRGVDPFEQLWKRRTTLEVGDLCIEVLSLPDLIAAKRTQRDKDWLMTNRLVEAHHAAHRDRPTDEQVRFWLTQSFDLEFLALRVAEYSSFAADRDVVRALGDGDEERAKTVLEEERAAVVGADRAYWAPLKQELEALRRRS